MTYSGVKLSQRALLAHAPPPPPPPRRRVFVASPLAPTETRTLEQNLAYARACSVDSIIRGEAPFTPHLLYTQMLDDADPAGRALGIECGMAFLAAVDALVVYDDHGVSNGMQAEIDAAWSAGLRIEFRRMLSEVAP